MSAEQVIQSFGNKKNIGIAVLLCAFLGARGRRATSELCVADSRPHKSSRTTRSGLRDGLELSTGT